MSDLAFLERQKLEKLFGMRSGYVLDFSDRTFQEFVAESTAKNIFDAKYHFASGSKANRFRAFWKIEPNHIVGRLIGDLLEYMRHLYGSPVDAAAVDDCGLIAKRLMQGAPVEEIEAVSGGVNGKDFEVLAQSVRAALERNEPETGLDRLHTFVVKYLRSICDSHGIQGDRGKPLHSLLGEYVKFLKEQKLIESGMTERILKSSIAILDAFNQVRNDRSLAHDNPLLNYDESLLILNHVASTVRFIRAIEGRISGGGSTEQSAPEEPDGLPF